jgi:hypothetical protein
VTFLGLSEEDRAELTRLEEAMWRGDTRFDHGFQQARFAADFFEFGRSGRVYTREQVVSAQSREIRAVLPMANLAIRLLDQNTAQVTYDSEVTYGEVTEHARRSSIWSRGASGWVMRFHQGTPYSRGSSPDAR